MKVALDLKNETCQVVRQEGDKPIYGESALYHAIKKALQAQGHDVIKKCPDKDGHMFSAPYYLRERKWKFFVYDGDYAIRDLAKDFREYSEVDLMVQNN